MDSAKHVLKLIAEIGSILLVIVFGIGLVVNSIKKGGNLSNKATEEIDKLSIAGYTQYDRAYATGTNVQQLIINAESTENIYVLVKTSMDTSGEYYAHDANGNPIAEATEKAKTKTAFNSTTNAKYISTKGKFYGECQFNANGELLGITFTQE